MIEGQTQPISSALDSRPEPGESRPNILNHSLQSHIQQSSTIKTTITYKTPAISRATQKRLTAKINLADHEIHTRKHKQKSTKQKENAMNQARLLNPLSASSSQHKQPQHIHIEDYKNQFHSTTKNTEAPSENLVNHVQTSEQWTIKTEQSPNQYDDLINQKQDQNHLIQRNYGSNTKKIDRIAQ